MNKISLGKMERVALRDVWPNEATDFTKWLAKEENLAMLGEATGIDLELVETESPVGSFSADIYAKESGTGRRAIVENQLEDTNHDHLGKIITYAAGKDAQIVIWIVAHARDEHRQAIEWLNQHTDSDCGFFLLEIELWSIGGSAPAPRFNVVERPNDWAKAAKESASLSDTQRLRIRYWSMYHEMAEEDEEFRKRFTPHRVTTDNWTNLACGSSVFHLTMTVSTSENNVGVGVYVPNDKKVGQELMAHRDEFEKAIGVPVTEINGEKASGVRFYKTGCEVAKRDDKWPEYIQWQLDSVVKLKDLLGQFGMI